MGLPNLFLQFTDSTWRLVILNFKMGVSNPNHIWRRLKKMVHIVWVVSLLKCDAIAVKSTRVWLPYKFLMCARKSQLFRLKVEKNPFFNAKICAPFRKETVCFYFWEHAAIWHKGLGHFCYTIRMFISCFSEEIAF